MNTADRSLRRALVLKQKRQQGKEAKSYCFAVAQ